MLHVKKLAFDPINGQMSVGRVIVEMIHIITHKLLLRGLEHQIKQSMTCPYHHQIRPSLCKPVVIVHIYCIQKDNYSRRYVWILYDHIYSWI